MPTFGTVCDGIGCGHLAFNNAGFDCAWSFEIEAFPSAVLAYRFPGVRNHGDMLKCGGMIESGEIEAPDVFIGGTPCQAFSVAGKRKGLEDARGNLSLTFCGIADAIDAVRERDGKQPCAVCWENVPGVLSDKGNAFGCFLGEMAGSGCELQPPGGRWGKSGCVFGPKRVVAWTTLDSQWFGVAQRRSRVFVVASAGDGCRPEEVLLIEEGMRRDSPPSREKREGASRGIEIGPSGGCFTDLNPTLDARCKDGPIRNQLAGAVLACHTTGAGFWREGIGTLRAREQDSHENVCPTLSCNHEVPIATYDMRGNGDGVTVNTLTGDHAGRPTDYTPVVAIQERACAPDLNCGPGGKGFKEDGTAFTLEARNKVQAVAFGPRFVRTSGGQPSIDPQPCLRADANTGDGAPCVAIGVDEEQNAHVELMGCLKARERGGGFEGSVMTSSMQVRRLLPSECEALQGLPRNWTLIPWRGKPPADCPDGPRYKGIGNGQTVSVMQWLARRIKAEMTR